MYVYRKWYKNWILSLIAYVRDTVVMLLPVNRLPQWAVRMVYGQDIHFVFLVHPRRSQDYFVALPFLAWLRKRISKTAFLKLVQVLPPFVLARVRTPSGVNGVVMTTMLTPESMIANRKKAEREAQRLISFSARISVVDSYIGLGAWWPIVTGRGRRLRDYAASRRCCITNGHLVTTLSISLMIERLAEKSNIPLSSMGISIIGAGKIGKQVARTLIEQGVRELLFIDKSEKRLQLIRAELKERYADINVRTYCNEYSSVDMKSVLSTTHLAVCATSSTSKIITGGDIPEDFIIIDDSRPEAVCRRTDDPSKLVIEGGLMRIPGLQTDYDYGIGIDENVFGCLCEAYMLALHRGGDLKPTIGEVNMSDMSIMRECVSRYQVGGGDFKCMDRFIPDEQAVKIILDRHRRMYGAALPA